EEEEEAMSQLDGRVVLISGADTAGGLARALAATLAAAGARILLLGERQADLQEIADAADAGGRPVEVFAASPLIPESVEAAIKQVQNRAGGVDVLVNLVPGSLAVQLVGQYAPAEWLETLQRNLYAPFLATRACLPL